MPRSPLGLVIVAFAIPIAWFAVGYAVAADTEAFLDTPDVTGQLWFFPLHCAALRVVGTLWASRLEPSLEGLALDDRARIRIRRGALGHYASIGALVACTFFIVRDSWFGLVPGESGLIPFDDPEMWDMAELGRPVHLMMLGLWCLEWLMFGYLLWLQIWILIAWTQAMRKADLADRLDVVLVEGGYKRAFSLFGRTTTVSLVFALGNLGFIAFTGELIPREAVEIESISDFLSEMSDLLSTSMLFLLTLIAAFAFVGVLRGALKRAVSARFTAAGRGTLTALAEPLTASSDLATDVERLRVRSNAQAEVLRAVIYQREVEGAGGKAMVSMVAKALIPLVTTAIKLRKVLGI
ncbi:MAG: hypothetical protein H0V17_17915 [Deltaproteobacteria bacterium]|nr:hypothetical protein [Deltaproteobacteria bacterium]